MSEIIEVAKDHLKEIIYPIIFIVVSFLLAPLLNLLPPIQDQGTKEIVTRMIVYCAILGIFVILIFLTRSNIKMQFYFPERELILNRSLSINNRSANFFLYVDKNETRLFKLVNAYLKKKFPKRFFYEIYWEPKEALNIEFNDRSNSADEYPIFRLNELAKNNKYSLKTSIGTLTQCTDIPIKIRRIRSDKSKPLGYILFCLIKIRYTHIVIKIE